MAIVGILSLAFMALLVAVPHSEPGGFDRRWGAEIQSIPWGDLRVIPELGSEIGGGVIGFYVAPAMLAGALAWKRQWTLLGLLGAVFLLHYVMISPKQFLEAARPSPAFGVDGGGGLESFPSGHVQWSVSFWGFAAVLMWRQLRGSPARWAVPMVLAVIVAGTMLGRIELGRHWPLDTVAGVLAGVIALRLVLLVESLQQRGSLATRTGR